MTARRALSGDVRAVRYNNRSAAPFDLPEAEAELVAGYHTEYSAMKFAMFYMAEYIHTIVASAVGAALWAEARGFGLLPWIFLLFVATAFALAYPDKVRGLVLLSSATHLPSPTWRRSPTSSWPTPPGGMSRAPVIVVARNARGHRTIASR